MQRSSKFIATARGRYYQFYNTLTVITAAALDTLLSTAFQLERVYQNPLTKIVDHFVAVQLASCLRTEVAERRSEVLSNAPQSFVVGG